MSVPPNRVSAIYSPKSRPKPIKRAFMRAVIILTVPEIMLCVDSSAGVHPKGREMVAYEDTTEL